MKEQLISLETAKLAKEKGFAYWNICTCGGFPDCICENRDLAIQSILQKWLREKHNIYVFINFTNKQGKVSKFYPVILAENNIGDAYISELHLTYEEALEQGLQEALKLIK